MSNYYQGFQTGWVIVALLMVIGCEEKKAAEGEPKTTRSSQPSEKNGHGPKTQDSTADSVDGEKSNTKTPPALGTKSGRACLSGKYRFDYAEVPLQEVMDGGPSGTVVKKQTGSADCIFEAPPKNNWSCTTTEPFVAEVEANQAGMPMTMNIKMEGTAKMNFKLLEGDSFKVESTDMADFKMGGTINLAGKEIALPTEQLPHSFGDEGTTWNYACEGDALVLSSDIGTGKHLSYRLARIE